MSSHAEEQQPSRIEGEKNVNNDAVRSRVSELLDNATVIPDDAVLGNTKADAAEMEDASNGRPSNEDASIVDTSIVDAPADGTTVDQATDDDGAIPAISIEDTSVAGTVNENPVDENSAGENPPDKAALVGEDDGGPVTDGEVALEGSHSADAAVETTSDEVVLVEDAKPEPEEPEHEETVPAETAKKSSSLDASDAETEGAIEPEDQDESEAGASSGAEELDPDDAVFEDDITPSAVRIRGRPGGVLVEIDEEGEWKDILKLLEVRLAAAEGFFRGGRAVLEVGQRDVYEDELRKARELLARHDMTLVIVRSTSDLTLQSSLLLGLSTSNQAAKPVEPDRGMAPVVPITQPKSPYFVHNGTLRSGQILRKAESIVIVGDVNPGAKVISSGDVMVWGRLRGIAYAGAGGNQKALVAAIEFSPTQLRISTVTAVPPDAPKSRGLRFWKKPEPEKRPEVAHVADGRIVVEPWDDSRPGRPRIARR
jgi:septum site-determining protein MinC